MNIIGISAFYHDSAACLVKDGEIIAAAQEERFTRVKHDSNFPTNAIEYCINEGKIDVSEIDYIAFYDKPFLKFERLLETYLAFAPKGFKSFSTSMPLWIKDKLFQKSMITKELSNLLGNKIDWKKKLLFSEHHISHAASAFFPSPFEDAAHPVYLVGVLDYLFFVSLLLSYFHDLFLIFFLHLIFVFFVLIFLF